MKKVIRSNVFETNSSSTHAICICTEEIPSKIPEKLYFGIGEHGWEFETLCTPEDKANYLYTAILELYGKEGYKEKIEHLSFALKDICEVEFEEPIWWSYSSLEYGYIDHYDGLKEFVEDLFNNDTLLFEYLFSNKSFINKGNDNSYGDVDFTVDYPHIKYYKWN